jgi:hypothetical protein
MLSPAHRSTRVDREQGIWCPVNLITELLARRMLTYYARTSFGCMGSCADEVWDGARNETENAITVTCTISGA